MKIITYPFIQISEWNSQKEDFVIEVREVTDGPKILKMMERKKVKTLQFQSRQAELINDCMCDWQEQVEREIEDSQLQSKVERKKGRKGSKSISFLS